MADQDSTAIETKAQASHTPGPWAWFGNTANHDICLATEHGGRRFVMTFTRWGMRGSQPRFQVDGRMKSAEELVLFERDYRKDIESINHPDARLIAAAPELLEAARDAVHIIQCIAENWPEQVGILASLRDAVHVRGVRVPSVQERLEAAIAKAEGRA